MNREALRKAYLVALRLHEQRRPDLHPGVDTLTALDDYEAKRDVWLTQWLRLRLALNAVDAGLGERYISPGLTGERVEEGTGDG